MHATKIGPNIVDGSRPHATAESEVGVGDASLVGLAKDAVDRLRTEWFFRQGAGASATRLEIGFDDLLEHLEEAFDLDLLQTQALRETAISRIIENLDDLLLAIACVKGGSAAWVELEQDIGPLLARMCELRIDQADAMLHASRFLRSVRSRTREETLADELPVNIEAELEGDDGTPCLQDYTGLHPLRAYLGGPLFAMLQDLIRDGLVEATRAGDPGNRPNRRLRLVD